MSFDGNNRLAGNEEKITSLRLQYQLGLRFLSIYNSTEYRNITFYNLISGLGFSVVTGAWDKNKADNPGLIWLNFRGLFSGNPSTILANFFQQPVNSIIFGYSIGLGVDITQLLNVRAFYFRFLNNKSVTAFAEPVLLASVNYSFRY
jgi:hypothetical protein